MLYQNTNQVWLAYNTFLYKETKHSLQNNASNDSIFEIVHKSFIYGI